jgi:hypothetical protein
VFILLLAASLVAVAIHAMLLKERTTRRIGEIAMLYILAGYCGVAMLASSLFSLANAERFARMHGFPTGSPFQDFTAVAMLGMSILSLLALWYRGTYLIAPAVCWAVFFGGATWIHAKDLGDKGAFTHGGLIAIFVTHGLISVLLIVALLMSGVWKER